MWFRFRTLCILLLHKGALQRQGEEETWHNSFPSHCKTQVTCRRQRASDPPENFISMRTEKMPPQSGACHRVISYFLTLNSFSWHSAQHGQTPGLQDSADKLSGPFVCVGIVPHNLMARGNAANTWSALIRGKIACTTHQLFSPHREHTGFPVNARKRG